MNTFYSIALPDESVSLFKLLFEIRTESQLSYLPFSVIKLSWRSQTQSIIPQAIMRGFKMAASSRRLGKRRLGYPGSVR